MALAAILMAVIALGGCDGTVDHGDNGANQKMCSRIDGLEQQSTTETSAYAAMYAIMWVENVGDPCDLNDVDGASLQVANRLATEMTIYKNGVVCAYRTPNWNTSQTDTHSGFTSCKATINDGIADTFTGKVVFSYSHNGYIMPFTSQAVSLTL
jgi:hypothetical protein